MWKAVTAAAALLTTTPVPKELRRCSGRLNRRQRSESGCKSGKPEGLVGAHQWRSVFGICIVMRFRSHCSRRTWSMRPEPIASTESGCSVSSAAADRIAIPATGEHAVPEAALRTALH